MCAKKKLPVNVAMDKSVMHLEIVCESTQIGLLVHWTILEITHERQDALVGVSVLPALKEPSHHDVLDSVRLAFNRFHNKNAKRSNLQRSPNVHVAIGVSPALTNAWDTFY